MAAKSAVDVGWPQSRLLRASFSLLSTGQEERPVPIAKKLALRITCPPQSEGSPLGTWGLLACGFFVAHAVTHVARGTPEHAIWACHVSSLLIGIGLLSGRAQLNASGLLVLVVGVPVWLVNLMCGGQLIATSLLTHLGGLAAGVIGVRRLGWPRPVWFQALLVVVALIAASIWWTPPVANVNSAFGGPPILGEWSRWPGLHLAGLLLFWAVSLWSAERLIVRWLPPRRSESA